MRFVEVLKSLFSREKPLAVSMAAGDGPRSFGQARDFTFRVYRQLVAEHPGRNIFASPFSIAMLLGMALEGARGATAEEIARALGRDPSAAHEADFPWDGDSDDPEVRRPELNELAETDQVEVNIANGLFGEQRIRFREEYVETLRSRYRSDVLYCDFAGNPGGEVRRINQWASDQTNGMIPQPLEGGAISAATRLVLMNAIYFKGEWQTPFEDKATRNEPFLCLDGRVDTTPMMSNRFLRSGRYVAFNADGSVFHTPQFLPNKQADDRYGYPAQGGFQLMDLPYKGQEISMLVPLPGAAGDLALLENQVDAQVINACLEHMEHRTINVTLPKFKVESHYDLNPTLSELGMRKAFSENAADFSAMTAANGLYISGVMQQAICDVNEKGTEAAAVTGMRVGLGGPTKVPFIPVFQADRPFLYLILHRATRTILFLGRMIEPAPA